MVIETGQRWHLVNPRTGETTEYEVVDPGSLGIFKPGSKQLRQAGSPARLRNLERTVISKITGEQQLAEIWPRTLQAGPSGIHHFWRQVQQAAA